MNRRRSLLALGAVGATACGYYAWHERRGLTRADFGAEDAGVPGSPAISPAVRAILEYALLAPSGHNTQPWTVRGTDGELRIGTERSHWLPKVDPSNRELALSVGAFLENLLIAAPGLGYAADFTVTGADASDRELLLVRLTGTPARAVPFDKLRGRRTIRLGQLARSLSGDDVRSMTADYSKEAHFVSADSSEGRYLAEGTIEANRAQALRDDAQEELAQWIR